RARERAFDRAEHKFDLMEELGTDLLMACSTVHPDSLPGLSRAADDYYELGERAARRHLRVAYEALAWGRHIHDYRDSWEVVRRAAHPNVGLVLDTFHIFSRQTELGTIGRIPGDRIFLVQTADAPRLSMDHLSWSRHYRCFPGQGELQMDKFMAMLDETRYDGPLSHEIFNDVFRMGHSDQTARDGLRSY
ncbi:sugar phosphate isomerase/epimerase family protein, partial [Halomonas campaniensis]